MPSPARKVEKLLVHGPWWTWEEGSGVMRLFTDPAISQCNPLFWRLQILWHPVVLLVLLIAYQALNVLIHGLHLLTPAQLEDCVHLWLRATCWSGLVAPAGLLVWLFGGFLYRQTQCKLFSPEHCSNAAWHRVNLPGVSVRCAVGALCFAHLYPTLWCLSMGRGQSDSSPEACRRKDCDVAARLEVWLAFALAGLCLCLFALHWCSCWRLQPLWRGGGRGSEGWGVVLDGLRLAWSLLLPLGLSLAALLFLDARGAGEHCLLLGGGFAFVACLGAWSRWLRRGSWGWTAPLLTAMTAAVLALAFSIRAREWYYAGIGLGEPEIPKGMEGVQERELGEESCTTLHWHREWLAWARRLDADAGKLAARKLRSLIVCALSVPACILSFFCAVQSRGSRFSRESKGCLHGCLGLLAALLGFVISVALSREQPYVLSVLAVKLLRWLAIDGLAILSAAAFACSWAQFSDSGGAGCCACARPCLACLPLALGVLCGAAAAALLLGGVDYEELLGGQDVRDFMRSNSRLEAAHVALFALGMASLSYLARSAYWRRHWSRRWQLTPLDHQGLCTAPRLGFVPGGGVQPQWAYDQVGDPKEDSNTPDDFWRQKQRLICGVRARMLHLSIPLVGLTLWQKLRLYRQSLALTVQATTSTVWRYMDRLEDVKGYAPPIVAPSLILSLWFPGTFARALRLVIVVALWYSHSLPAHGATSPQPWEDVREDADVLATDAGHAWGYAVSQAAKLLDQGGAKVWEYLASGAVQFLGMEGQEMESWFVQLALPYRCTLVANVVISLTVALCWRALGLFSCFDAVMQAAIIFIDSDSQCRKAVLLRDGTLSPMIKIAWLLATVVTQCLLPLRAMMVSRYWLNPCGLLDVLLQQGLVPGSAHMLAVSAIDMKDGLRYNSMLLDGQFTQSVALAISSALSVLGNAEATLTDLCLFALQIFFKTIKGPLDAHSLRLLRLTALCEAIQKQRDGKLTTAWDVPPGQCCRRFVGSEAVRGVDLEARSWTGRPGELKPEDSEKDETGWSLGFAEVPVRLGWFRTERRLAAQLTIPEDDLWAVWTLQIEGRHCWFRRQDSEGFRSISSEDGRLTRSSSTRSHSSDDMGSLTSKAKVPPPPPPRSMEGQWVRWYAHEVQASAKEVFRVEGTDLVRPEVEGQMSLVPQGENRYAVHSATGTWTGKIIEANDWGMLAMSDGTRWVRSGPQALMQGMMYNDIRVWTRYDSYSDATGVLTFQWRDRTARLHLKGRWTEDFHVFELRKKHRVNFGKDAFTVQYLRFRPGAILVYVQYDETVRAVTWTMSPAAERVETAFSQTFTGESIGRQEDWHLPRALYPSWWWAKLRCRSWAYPREGHACMADSRDHPRFNYHKGPGRLVSHHDPEAREAVGRKDAFHSSCFLGNDMVKIDRVTLVLHACARKFRAPTCCEGLDLSGRCYAAAAESEGYIDGLKELGSPSELHAKLWPDVERSAELSEEEASGYVEVGSLVASPEEDSAASGLQRRALTDA